MAKSGEHIFLLIYILSVLLLLLYFILLFLTYFNLMSSITFLNITFFLRFNLVILYYLLFLLMISSSQLQIIIRLILYANLFLYLWYLIVLSRILLFSRRFIVLILRIRAVAFNISHNNFQLLITRSNIRILVY